MSTKDSHDAYSKINSLADEELGKIKQALPEDPIPSFLLFTETVRVSDYFQLGNPDFSENGGFTFQERDIMKMGWNLAASLLFKPINVQGFPIRKSIKQTISGAANLLYRLGSISLLKRSAEMVRTGALNVEIKNNTFRFTATSTTKRQFLDELELLHLDKHEKKLNDKKGETYKGWDLMDQERLSEVSSKIGNYLGFRDKEQFSNYKLDNIDKKMLPLINPWDSGHGIMMGYDSTPEIDNHFLAIATELIGQWRNEAGFHPEIKINGISAAELMSVVALIVSIHLKHIHFAGLASANYPEISIPESLAIWDNKKEFIESISEYSGMNVEVVSKALNIISLNPNDSSFLRDHTSKFMPLVIDIGNGFILRPVSSVFLNPLHSISALAKSRDPQFQHRVSVPREKWLRRDLYALFAGSRYKTIEGNIKLRKDNQIVTDIDAVIYDKTSGELGIFQIKWQDYFMNDVKKLRSKASNLTSELDEWANKVNKWIREQGTSKLTKSLRMKKSNRVQPSNIYLFGISKNAVRMQGYGFTLEENSIAISTWAQFVRNRHETGPIPNVISNLHKRFKKEENKRINIKPMPMEINIGDKKFYFKDLWSAYSNEEE